MTLQAYLFNDVPDKLVKVAVNTKLDIMHKDAPQFGILFNVEKQEEGVEVNVLKSLTFNIIYCSQNQKRSLIAKHHHSNAGIFDIHLRKIRLAF